jgi:hypothetical protein
VTSTAIARMYIAAALAAGAIYVNLQANRAMEAFPTATPKPYASVTPYSFWDFFVTPTLPPYEDPTPAYVVSLPTPVPAPTYDDTPISDDLDRRFPDDVCDEYNGCAHYICHYDEGSLVGTDIMVGPRVAAAHLAQHPNDYRDNYDDRPCATLSDPTPDSTPEETTTRLPKMPVYGHHPTWRNNEVNWQNEGDFDPEMP